MSLFGDLKYPADFSHFDYVNPTRRRAGGSSYGAELGYNQNPITFNTLNIYVPRATAPPAWG